MAQHSRIAVKTPPTAPERESTGRLMLRAFVTVTLFGLLAHSAVYNTIGPVGAQIALVVLLLGVLAIGVPAIARQQPQRFPWRRLPWAALGYVALAVLSTAWTQWPLTTLTTAVLLVIVTATALFIASALTWYEIVRSLATALKAIIALSVAAEVWVAVVVRHPVLPFFSALPEGEVDPHWYWIRGNLWGFGRIQGIVGNSNLLAQLCLLALIVFGVLYAARLHRRSTLAIWAAFAALLFLRAGSATAWVGLGVVGAVTVAAMLIRAARGPNQRRRIYLGYGAAALAAAAAALFLRTPIARLLGRDGDLTGRDAIWAAVGERGAEHPVVGNGFASPWLPWDPAFDGWIIDHGITVFHAHNMWLDVWLQLGALGVAVMAGTWIALTWRAWFFAVDRPRWSIRQDSPYSAVALLPILVVALLLTQGLSESGPIMLWGWMLVVLLSFKIKTVPFISPELSERSRTVATGPESRPVP